MIDPSLCEGLALLMEHEGFRGQPYQDTKGNWTIGYGRNLDANPLTEEEGRRLLLGVCLLLGAQLKKRYPWFDKLNTVRKWVILDMAYQLGFNGFGSFQQMRAEIEKAVKIKEDEAELEWMSVRDEMLDSKWAREFPPRAEELAELMVRGAW
jgi:lysozyme